MNADSFIVQMQLERYEIFKAQDPANSHFDITFEVDGKIIYANKYVLETISTTLKSMLSDRWSNKDDVIKLDTYSYENFHQFLTFIYSGKCDITDENISIMLDMAEFYAVTAFKDFCDEYMAGIEFSIDNLFGMVELVEKYSLPTAKESIDSFTQDNFHRFLEAEKFSNLEKTSIEKLVTFKRGKGLEEKLFEAVYKWTENQFIADESSVKRKYVNMNEGMKAELSGILPHIKFDKMCPQFLNKFVVSKGFLFTYEQLSTILCDHQKIKVTVKDNNGHTLTGSFDETFNAYDTLKSFETTQSKRKTAIWCYSSPTIPSDLKKNESVQFYFVLGDRRFQVKKTADVIDKDYLLCEMEGDPTFVLDSYCQISVSRNCFSS